MKSVSILTSVAFLPLVACTTAPSVPLPPSPPPVAACDAAPVRWAIGERAGTSVLERVTLESGSQSARVVHPGEAVTLEFNPARITIEVDGRNRIVDLRCG